MPPRPTFRAVPEPKEYIDIPPAPEEAKYTNNCWIYGWPFSRWNLANSVRRQIRLCRSAFGTVFDSDRSPTTYRLTFTMMIWEHSSPKEYTTVVFPSAAELREVFQPFPPPPQGWEDEDCEFVYSYPTSYGRMSRMLKTLTGRPGINGTFLNAGVALNTIKEMSGYRVLYYLFCRPEGLSEDEAKVPFKLSREDADEDKVVLVLGLACTWSDYHLNIRPTDKQYEVIKSCFEDEPPRWFRTKGTREEFSGGAALPPIL
ncbi:hypothetical protein BKA70DRAFT_1568419 [Coprinopsis sp. MPI-PUGE-AT-0042]|nr:hypothetical protein BKA70DRAFT_1568419 [Coprinopsis sp. MPI-PUGE-AT-0042]